MQPVDTFIQSLPRDEKVIVQRLRMLILDSDPRLYEKMSYGVPYYGHHRRIVFIWPSSHPPYTKRSDSSCEVMLGFCYGNMLSDRPILLKENRKQVSVIRFNSLAQIDDRLIRELMQEAILVDETFKKTRIKKNG